ncbi:unnamed protein product [Bursaphelenchus okinawaensis]|uniref:Bifunctional lysine-specific demethylase and histidyl-hydroxylase NO66 n=1 Tax=Bursaphelenchus okinawaensis TaxID=465554 RepID=A0A811L2T0_9BILA|nr:unnamed protein product [Bursaphelenchus okinawaensis]CAG9117764.1 unnamed protein product [Bursaphelenchus okinawaensis]
MGRHFETDLLALGRKQQEERRKLEQEKKKQWENVDKYVPIYELAKENGGENGQKAGPSKEIKKTNLRNDGLNGKGVSMAEIKKAAKNLSTNVVRDLAKVNGVKQENGDKKKKKKKPKKKNKQTNGTPVNGHGDIKGAEVLGEALTPIKRQGTRIAGRFIESSDSAMSVDSPARSDASFISLKDLKPSTFAKKLNFDDEEEEDSEDEEEVMEVEDEDGDFELDSEDESDVNFASRVASLMDSSAMEGDSEESGAEDEIFGPVDDLEEESEDLEDEDVFDEEDLDFIDDEAVEYEDDDGSESDLTDEESRITEMDTDEEIELGLKPKDAKKKNTSLVLKKEAAVAKRAQMKSEQYLKNTADESQKVNGKKVNGTNGVGSEDDEGRQESVKQNSAELLSAYGLLPQRKAKVAALFKEGMEFDYESTDDSDFDQDEADDDEDLEDADPVDEDEINDILMDNNDEEVEFEDEYEDSSEDDDEEMMHDIARRQHISPEGIVNEGIELEVAGFEVTEPGPTCVVIDRDLKKKWEGQKYELFGFNKGDEHSVNAAVKAFRWFIGPVGPQDFFQKIYARRMMIIQRKAKDYYSSVFPITDFHKLFQDNFLEYGVNANVAKYKNGQRTTHNGEGRITSGKVVQHFADGCSIQVVNPQSFNQNIHYICDQFQELFNCFVGANCYYTPKKTAGFAPHWDDIDAFLIQTAGRKHWKIYGPSDTDEIWPLESSGNFTAEEMTEREDTLVFDGWLEAGDILYLPRGYIHCATADKNVDSLHVTISLAQNFTYAEMMKEMATRLVESQTAMIPQVRKNLPINLAEICGVANINYDNEEQMEKKLLEPLDVFMEQQQLSVQAIIPAVVDMVVKQSLRRSLPPLLTHYEREHSIYGVSGQIPKVVEFGAQTEVRIIRKHTQRLMFQDEDVAFLVHRMHNSMVYEGRPETVVDVPEGFAPLIEILLNNYPEWSTVKELGSDLKINKAVCKFLYLEGLLLVNNGKSKARKMNVVVELPKNIIGVLKKKNTSLNESSDRKVSFSPDVKVKKFLKDQKFTEKKKEAKNHVKQGKIVKKKNQKPQGKTRSGNKKRSNKFK